MEETLRKNRAALGAEGARIQQLEAQLQKKKDQQLKLAANVNSLDSAIQLRQQVLSGNWQGDEILEEDVVVLQTAYRCLIASRELKQRQHQALCTRRVQGFVRVVVAKAAARQLAASVPAGGLSQADKLKRAVRRQAAQLKHLRNAMSRWEEQRRRLTQGLRDGVLFSQLTETGLQQRNVKVIASIPDGEWPPKELGLCLQWSDPQSTVPDGTLRLTSITALRESTVGRKQNKSMLAIFAGESSPSFALVLPGKHELMLLYESLIFMLPNFIPLEPVAPQAYTRRTRFGGKLVLREA